MRSRWGIRERVILAAVLPTLILALLLTTLFTDAQLEEIEAVHTARATALARQLATNSEYAMFSGNTLMLQRLARVVLAEDNVAGITVVGANGVLLTRSDQSELPPPPQHLLPHEQVLFLDTLTRVIEPIQPAEINVDDDIARVLEGHKPHHAVLMGNVILDVSISHIKEKQFELRMRGLGFLILVLLGTLVLGILVSQGVSQPIRRIAHIVTKIGQGEFSQRTPVEGGGTLRVLAEGVNQMAAELSAMHQDLNQKINEATAELRASKDEAENASVAKTRFLAAASHDLRQPMHALVLFLGELSQYRLEGPPARLIEQINTAVTAMADLLDNLLDISRLDTGTVRADIQDFPLYKIFERIAFAQRPYAAELDVALHFYKTQCWVRSDPILLERILSNLVTNAVRYSSGGSVLIGCRFRGDTAVIEVRDNGIGISEDALQLIFQEFVQLGNPERTREKGLGLGLAIVARLAKVLNHPVSVRSSEKKGSIFSCQLPRVMPRTQLLPQKDYDPLPQAPQNEVQMLIMCEDDGLRQTIEPMLERWGVLVVFVDNEEALLHSPVLQQAPPASIIIVLDDFEKQQALLPCLRQKVLDATAIALICSQPDAQTQRLAREQHVLMMNQPLRPAKLRAFFNRALTQQEELYREFIHIQHIFPLNLK